MSCLPLTGQTLRTLRYSGGTAIMVPFVDPGEWLDPLSAMIAGDASRE